MKLSNSGNPRTWSRQLLKGPKLRSYPLDFSRCVFLPKCLTFTTATCHLHLKAGVFTVTQHCLLSRNLAQYGKILHELSGSGHWWAGLWALLFWLRDLDRCITLASDIQVISRQLPTETTQADSSRAQRDFIGFAAQHDINCPWVLGKAGFSVVWMEVDHVPSACGLTSLTTSAASLLRYTWPHLSQKSRRCPSLAVPGRPTVCMVRSSQVHQVQDQGQNMALLAATTRPMSHGLTFTKGIDFWLDTRTLYLVWLLSHSSTWCDWQTARWRSTMLNAEHLCTALLLSDICPGKNQMYLRIVADVFPSYTLRYLPVLPDVPAGCRFASPKMSQVTQLESQSTQKLLWKGSTIWTWSRRENLPPCNENRCWSWDIGR